MLLACEQRYLRLTKRCWSPGLGIEDTHTDRQKRAGLESRICHGDAQWPHSYCLSGGECKVSRLYFPSLSHMLHLIYCVCAYSSMLPRDLAKTESNSDPVFDGVVHISASDSCTNNASILNDALHKIFPSHAAIPPTAVVAVLEDDQASQ